MQGLIQSAPLTVDRILRHAASAHGQGEVVTAALEGAPRRANWAQVESRVRRLAGALVENGLRAGDVAAVIGKGTGRQFEAWYAIMTAGAVCHPISPNLPPDQIAALMRAHGDKTVLIEPDLLPALEPALLKLPQLDRVISMGEAGQSLATRMHGVVSQDALMEMAGRPLTDSPADEAAPALLTHDASCARSGLWSHRACVLQGLAAQGPGGLDLAADDSVLVLAPFWRGAAAGALFSVPLAGARLVLPGPRTEIAAARIQADRESATLVVGGPAELLALHEQFRSESRRPSALKRALAVGEPCPPSLVRAWRDSFGVEVWSGWGAVEAAGLAAVARGTSRLKPLFGIELELADGEGRPRPHDGQASGRLTVHGPLVSLTSGATHADTGDLATIDSQGGMTLLGRADEQVLAAGAQVPSWPIEAAALEHPATARAAAIDPPRGLKAEGPVLIIERKPGAAVGKPEYQRFLSERLGGLALGELLFVNGFPLDAAGRVDKGGLRRRLEQLLAPPAPPEPAPEPPPEPVAPPPLPPPPPEPIAAAAVVPAAAGTAVALYKEEPPEPEPEAVAEPAPEPPPEVQEMAQEPAQETAAEAPPSEAEPEVHEDAAALEAPEAPAEPPPQPEPAPEADALSLGPLTREPGPVRSDIEAEALPEDGIFLRLDRRPHAERRKAKRQATRVELFLNLVAALALVPALMVVAGALAVRFELIDWRVAVSQLILDWPSKAGLIAVLLGIFAVFAALGAGFRRYGLRAVFSLILPLATLICITWLKSVGDGYPPVHDVATDWTHPLALSPGLVRERGSDAYPVEDDPIVPASAGTYMMRRVAEVNGETCPGAKPAQLAMPPADAYARAKAAVLASGLSLFSDHPSAGQLEATATGLWLGLKDDVAIRVAPEGEGSRVDVRSIGRGGLSDFGANCRRVTDLVRDISGQPAGR
jgi:fatty-acyl-CoA synthase